jgi:hypothetical protein
MPLRLGLNRAVSSAVPRQVVEFADSASVRTVHNGLCTHGHVTLTADLPHWQFIELLS